MLAALRRVGRDRAVRAVILTGAGRAFCAGQDLREPFGGDHPTLEDEVRDRYNPLILASGGCRSRSSARSTASPRGRLHRWPWPATCASRPGRDVRARVHPGRARAGQRRVVVAAATRGQRPRRASWPSSATRSSAAEAERIGLVNRVVPADALLDEARSLGARLASGAPLALALTKRALAFAERDARGGARPRGVPPGHRRRFGRLRRGQRGLPREASAAVHRGVATARRVATGRRSGLDRRSCAPGVQYDRRRAPLSVVLHVWCTSERRGSLDRSSCTRHARFERTRLGSRSYRTSDAHRAVRPRARGLPRRTAPVPHPG